VVNFVSVEEGEKACAEAIQRYENSLLLQLTGAQRSLQESTGADRVQVQRKLSAGAVLHQVHHSRKPRSKSGFFGVSGVAVKTSAAKWPTTKWLACITVSNIGYYLGTFDTKEEAAAEYDKALKQHRGSGAHGNFSSTIEAAAKIAQARKKLACERQRQQEQQEQRSKQKQAQRRKQERQTLPESTLRGQAQPQTLTALAQEAGHPAGAAHTAQMHVPSRVASAATRTSKRKRRVLDYAILNTAIEERTGVRHKPPGTIKKQAIDKVQRYLESQQSPPPPPL
jgi:hypothetical protein